MPVSKLESDVINPPIKQEIIWGNLSGNISMQHDLVSFVNQKGNKCLVLESQGSQCINTTNETEIFSTLLPSGEVQEGDLILCKIGMELLQNSGGDNNLELILKAESDMIYSTSNLLASNTVEGDYLIEFALVRNSDKLFLYNEESNLKDFLQSHPRSYSGNSNSLNYASNIKISLTAKWSIPSENSYIKCIFNKAIHI